MSYQNFQQKVYSHLIKYKKKKLKIDGKGISARGVEHDCLLPSPYCDAKMPIMLYEGIKTLVEDIQESLFTSDEPFSFWDIHPCIIIILCILGLSSYNILNHLVHQSVKVFPRHYNQLVA